jgi:hypothetical protein
MAARILRSPIAIECDGQKVWITKSLHSALCKIRDLTSPGTMWIDALCISLWIDALYINQFSEPEAIKHLSHGTNHAGTII